MRKAVFKINMPTPIIVYYLARRIFPIPISLPTQVIKANESDKGNLKQKLEVFDKAIQAFN